MVDNDCNEVVDDMTREVPWYRDADGDGFGSDGAETRLSCEPLTSMGYSLLSSDCDDATRAISPAAAETCNGRDDDCNGTADFAVAPGDLEDDDNDGVVDLACGAPFGVDCDDRNPSTGPGSSEICDGRDNDCDTNVDEGATSAVFYRDGDMDGYGATTGGTIVGCMGMAGFVALGGDCDDADAARRPGATETCDGEDDDCDGAADDSVSLPPLPNAQVACVAGMPSIVRCDPNFENCNGTTSDGCEIDLTTDEMNCRFCGNACTSTGGESRECIAGDCRISSCPSGRRDCNGSAVDGCERAIGTTSDCGDCGDRCSLAHVTRQACVSGSCSFDPATDCEAGWADCDGMIATGCETPLGTSTNCSSCGNACTAMQFCDASMRACRTSTTVCTAPTADCDMNGSCETNTSSSVTNCGSCGRACSGGNATWSCASGGCTITACTGGFQDCDRVASNGCEAAPTSVTACGASCQVCMIPNGTPACTAGACTIASCNPGFADCNGSAADGCETSTSTDSANCGLCGNVCNNLPNVATGTCLASSCNVVVCDGGFADCTGASGCETSIVDDASNCGACGRTCGAGGQCGAGICDEILQIANGQYHTCALRSSGTVVCWGENGSGQLGIGTTTDQLTPVVVPGLSDVVDLVAGWEHTCALLANGRVRCWGGNGQDQVGDGSGSDQLSPTPVVEAATMGELDRVTDLGASRYGTCGLRTTGELACWGQNASGMIDPWDLGSATFAFARPATFDSCGDGCTPDRVVRFTMGARYIAAIVAYTGKGTFVELQAQGDAPGDIGSTAGVSYLPFGTLGDVVELASGNDHVCLRRASGTVECIGDNTNGQLADGSTITGSSPVVTLFTSATALMLFDDTTCVRNTLGQVYCMGATNEAECTGPGSAMPVLAPRRVNVAAGGAAYSARYLANGGGGAYRTPCLVSTAGAVHCWGNNIGGQIGNGNTTGQEYPTRVVGLTP
jgi:alpha-tubulin suppressor-like RCC1 family protein